MTVETLRQILSGLPGDMIVMFEMQLLNKGKVPLTTSYVEIFPDDTCFICCLSDEDDEKDLRRVLEHGNETTDERNTVKNQKRQQPTETAR